MGISTSNNYRSILQKKMRSHIPMYSYFNQLASFLHLNSNWSVYVNSLCCSFQIVERGIWSRIRAMQYKEMEMTIPVIKLCKSRRLSFVGTNTVLRVFVNSKSRWDIKTYRAVVSMKLSIGYSGIRERSHLGCPFGIFDLNQMWNCEMYVSKVILPSHAKRVKEKFRMCWVKFLKQM